MRNLKRVLSLALASIMLLGMMVVGASAADKTYADLTDSDKITNQEAVSVLVDIGIIEGKTDGSYDPSATVDRATMAKLITMMLMGDVDQSAFQGTVTDLKDIDKSWAEGYIKYCYSNGIITGDGKGNFFPTEPVTVVQAAKMLLVAIGYDADNRGYSNDANWSVNIMKDAQSTKVDATTIRSLTKGLSVKATDPLTRDNAAQMIFNALFVQTQKPNYQWDMGTQYIQSYTAQASLADTTYSGLTRYTGILDSVDGDGYAAIATLKASGVEASEAVTAGNKIKADPNNVGSTVVVYRDNNGYVSTAAIAVTGDVLATSTNGTSYANLTTKGKSGYIGYAEDDSVAYYSNGVAKTEDADIAAAKALADKVGVIVEFFDNDSDGKYDVVKFTEYNFSKVTATKAANESKGTEATVTVAGLNGGAAIKESLVVGSFADLEENDYVLCAKIGNQFAIYEPETFVGQMTAFNASKGTMTVDGTVYTMGDTVDVGSLDLKIGASELTGIAAKKDATFYLDSNGYLVASEAVSAEVNYAVVDKIAMVQTGGTGASKGVEAVLVYADGTTDTVNVTKINGVKVSAMTNNTGALTIADGAVTGVKVSSNVDNNAALTGLAVSYSESDGDYSLTYLNIGSSSVEKNGTVVSAGSASPTSVNVVTKGVPTFNVNTAGSVTAVANNSTVYVIKTGNADDGYTFKSYTGYKNVPTIALKGGADGEDASATVTYAVKSGTVASFVYINASDTKGTTSSGTAKAGDMAYITSTAYTTDNSGSSTVYVFDAIVNGAEDTFSTKDKALADSLTKDKLYELTVKDEYVTAATEQTGSTTYVKSEVAADAKDGVLDGYTYDGSETVIVILDGELSSGSAESAKDGDTIYVKVVDSTGSAAERIAIDTIYIVKSSD